MACNDDKKTQKNPQNKRKGNENDNPLTNSAGSQSGQPDSSARGVETGSDVTRRPSAMPPRASILPPNTLTRGTSVTKVGQTEMPVVRRDTGAPMMERMGLTRFAGIGFHDFSLPDDSGLAVSQDSGAANQFVGSLQALQGLSWVAAPDHHAQNRTQRRVVDFGTSEVDHNMMAARGTLVSDIEQKDEESSGKRKRDAEAEGDGQDQGRRPRKRQRRPFCVGCKSDQHYLSTCLKADDNGLMKGCPLCNTLDHSADDCNNPRVMDDVDRMNEFVYRRRNTPSFLTFESWYDLVRDNANPSPTDMDRFPWTPEFTKSIAASLHDLQKKVNDLGLEDAKLPVDPSVNGWTAVKGHFNHKILAARRNYSDNIVPEQAPVTAPNSSVSAIAEEQQVQSRLRPQHGDGEVEEYEVDSDDDLDNEEFRRKRMKEAEAKLMAMRP